MKLAGIILLLGLVMLRAEGAELDAARLIELAGPRRGERQVVSRAKLTVEDDGKEGGRSAQLLIKERREGTNDLMFVEVLWPTARKGERVCIRRKGEEPMSGFKFLAGGEVQTLTRDSAEEAFLESDLTIGDLAEDFWSWPRRELKGQEKIKEELCHMLEFEAGSGGGSGSSLVRCWISAEKLAPLKIEKYGRDGKLRKTITSAKLLKHEGRWIPKTLLVRKAGSTQQTVIELSRSKEEAVPLEEFTVDYLRRRSSSNKGGNK